jgi:hypothetical protein
LIGKLFLFLVLQIIAIHALAQDPSVRGTGGAGNVGKVVDRFGNATRGGSNAGVGNGDSLQKRNKLADSITISYRFLNDVKRFNLDSSISDYIRFATQPNYITLGNNGAASKPILYTPIMKAGFDEGKHSLDAYKWNINTIKFYKTTRPYTELGYVLGSKAEQNIHLTHTQNLKPDWNIAFDYRLISAPGYFRNQKNNHNNAAITSYYQGKRKRYANWFALINNSIKANDYGGILNNVELLDPALKDRAFIQTNLNNNVFSTRNPFDNKLESGTWDKERTYMLQHSYDFGKKDSIQVNDSTINYLFFPKWRLEHTLTLSNVSFLYKGLQVDSNYYYTNYAPDSLYKKSVGNFTIEDKLQRVLNDFSLYQYPDTKNTLQFIKAGVSIETWKGTFTEGSFRLKNKNLNNLLIHGEYRNRTRNKKWDLAANGALYLSGYNAGDYEANGLLIRDIGKKIGNLKLQFKNVNRSASFIFYQESVFNIQTIANIKKENHTEITAQLFNEKKQQNILAKLITSANLTTWQSFKLYRQEDLFNMLQLSFARTFKLNKWFVWHTEAHFQQTIIGSPKINYPKLYTRNRIAYEGNFGKKNLRIATGLEFRYLAPYKLDAWSPLIGQFFYQDSASSKTNLPDINAYMHFNITSFNAFIRVENLNTAKIINGNINPGLAFTNSNFAALRYPNPGLLVRFGIYWRFVN